MSAARSQRKAMDAAIRSANGRVQSAKPYISDMYRGGTDALNASLDAGYYGGPTYAGLNQTQTDAINAMEGTGRAGAADATNFMNLGRGSGRTTLIYTIKRLRICLATLSTMPAPMQTH